MPHTFINSVFNAQLSGLNKKVADLRYYRDATNRQDAFAAAVESFGLNQPLLMVASQSPEMLSMIPEEAAPALENLNVVGDKSIKLNQGITDKTLKSAGIQDWLDDTRDSLSDFAETANYHIAGIHTRLAENADRIEHAGMNYEAMVNAPSFDNREKDVLSISKALKILNEGYASDGVDSAAAELLESTGICKMGDDYETTPEGMYCLERFSQGSLFSLGYTQENLPHLLRAAEVMLRSARALVSRGGDLISAEYKEHQEDGYDEEHKDDKPEESTDSSEPEVSEEKTDSASSSQVTEQDENVYGRFDVEHPSRARVDHREDDVDAQHRYVPLKADPERDQLQEPSTTEGLEELSEEETLDGEISKMGNRLTVISCAIDCATHIGLHLLYISDRALAH